MDGNTELLNYIYQNAKMGAESSKHVAELATDDEFRKRVYLQRQEYQNISKLAENMLHEHGHEEKDLGVMAKAGSYMGIELKAMTDRTPSKLAELMIEGSNMGIIEGTKHLNSYENADREIRSLAKKLVRTEEDNLDHWKQYLS